MLDGVWFVGGALETPADIMEGSDRLVMVMLPSTCRIELCSVAEGNTRDDRCEQGWKLVRVGEVLLGHVLSRGGPFNVSGKMSLG